MQLDCERHLKPSIAVTSGTLFNIVEPQIGDLDLEDIAWALSKIPRFGGHGKPKYFSVAEHAILVSEILKLWKASPIICYAGLHHDDAEAYLLDIPAPIKRVLTQYKPLELKLLSLIAEKLSLRMTDFSNPQVKRADTVSRVIEQAALFEVMPHGVFPSRDELPLRRGQYDRLYREYGPASKPDWIHNFKQAHDAYMARDYFLRQELESR